jgi:uncharacterized surface protein with fasciclin (FAS1) repeats
MRRYNAFIALGIVVVAFTYAGCRPAADSSSGDLNLSAQGQAAVVDNVSKINIIGIARGSADHTTLAAAIDAAGLQHVLANPGPLTVFAPTNAAFDALPPGTVADLLKPENKSQLAKIVTSHAAPGTFKGAGLDPNRKIYLATGQYVSVEKRDGDTYVNGAKILTSIDASNGVVHVVDKVFLF